MTKPFWKKELTITRKSVFYGLIVVFVLSGIASAVFLNFIFPQLATTPGLRVLFPRFPIVVNRTEEITINEGIKSREVHEQLRKSTVTILKFRSTFDPRETGFSSVQISNGIIATSDGLILATKSGVGDPERDRLIIINDDGEVFDAKVLAFDPISELAMLRSDAENLSVASFGDSQEQLIGDKLLALFPSLSRSQGPVGIFDFEKKATAIVGFPNYFSSDSINEYLGIFPNLTPSDLSAVIGSRDSDIVGFSTSKGILTGEFLLSSIDNFLHNEDFVRPGLGINYVSVAPAIASALKLPADYGALVLSSTGLPAVAFGSAAAKAGLREGDFIYKINERELDEKNSLERMIYNLRPDDEVEIDFFRNGEEMEAIFILDGII